MNKQLFKTIIAVAKQINDYNQITEKELSKISDKNKISMTDFSTLCELLSDEGIAIVTESDLIVTPKINPLEQIKATYQDLSFTEKCKCISELVLLLDNTNKNDIKTISPSSSKKEKTSDNNKKYNSIPKGCLEYNFSQKNDIAYTSPVLLKVMDITIEEKSWADMFVGFLQAIYSTDKYKTKIVSFSKKTDCFATKSKAKKFRRARKIDENLFVETDSHTSSKLAVIKAVLDYCKIKYSDVQLYYVKGNK